MPLMIKNPDHEIYSNQSEYLTLEEMLDKMMSDALREDTISNLYSRLEETQKVVLALVSLLDDGKKRRLARKLNLKIKSNRS